MAHDHNHSHDESASKLRLALALTAGFAAVEVVGGIWTGSLALIADAGHMLTDATSLGLALWAARVAARPADEQRTYGYHRAQVLAAFVNGISLVAIAAWVVIEAVRRLLDPAPVMGNAMLVVAVLGMLVNLAAFRVLHGGDTNDVNRQGAMLHVLGDLLGSLAAIIAALIIMATAWSPADPLLSMVTAMIIGATGLKLARRTGHVLLEGVPEGGADRGDIAQTVADAVPGVRDVHHVHAWQLKPGMPLMTLHVALHPGADPADNLRSVHRVLTERFGCEHATVQLEPEDCPDGSTH